MKRNEIKKSVFSNNVILAQSAYYKSEAPGLKISSPGFELKPVTIKSLLIF